MESKHRKSPRLENYDYKENGCYFVTVYTKDRCPILRQFVGAATCRPAGIPPLSDCGMLVEQGILQIPRIYPHITLEQYAVMPNHIIRDEHDFLIKWHYIDTNPIRWESGQFYCETAKS